MAKNKGKSAPTTTTAPKVETAPEPVVTQPVATGGVATTLPSTDPFEELRKLQEMSSNRFGQTGAVAEPGKKGKGKPSTVKTAKPDEVRKVLPFLLQGKSRGQVDAVVAEHGCKGYSFARDRDGNPIVCHMAWIAPPVADYLLKNHNPHGKDGNRPMSGPLAKGYGSDMKDGKWGFAASALSFVGDNDTVGDAQHQLQGIVESGCEQLFVVCYGVHPDYADYINGGKPRSPKDAIARHGHFERFAEVWEKEGRQSIPALVSAHEKIFSEAVRTIGLRRLGLTVRGTHEDLKRKWYFRNLENLFTSATITVANVYQINRDTRGTKQNKQGKTVQTGKGALENLAQLAYFASAQYLAAGSLIETVNDDETVTRSVDLDMEIVKAINEFYCDVADARNDATKVVDGNYSAVNACRLRRFLELCNSPKSGIAGASNNVYMAKFTAILLAVQKTLCDEELSPADLNKVKLNPSNTLWLDISAINTAFPAGLDDYALRADKLDDKTLAEGSGEDSEESADDDEESEESADDEEIGGDDEESDDEESEE